VAVGKVAAHLCLTLIIKELKISVEQDRVVTTLNIIFSVVKPTPIGGSEWANFVHWCPPPTSVGRVLVTNELVESEK
jgi:hypothetical protein